VGRAALQGRINLGEAPVGREPIARLVIELYSLERQVAVEYLIPYGSELESMAGQSPTRGEGWKRLVSTLKRNLDEIVEMQIQRWARPEEVKFTSGTRVRILDNPNFRANAMGTIAESPGPRQVRAGVLYRVTVDAPEVNRYDDPSSSEAYILEGHLQPLEG
jgi:hypothetical protein